MALLFLNLSEIHPRCVFFKKPALEHCIRLWPYHPEHAEWYSPEREAAKKSKQCCEFQNGKQKHLSKKKTFKKGGTGVQWGYLLPKQRLLFGDKYFTC